MPATAHQRRCPFTGQFLRPEPELPVTPELRAVAIHEAALALLHCMLPNARRLRGVQIVPNPLQHYAGITYTNALAFSATRKRVRAEEDILCSLAGPIADILSEEGETGKDVDPFQNMDERF